MKILYHAVDEEWETYNTLLIRGLKNQGFSEFEILNDTSVEKTDIDFIIYSPKDQPSDFSQYDKLKAIFSLWAGIETIVENKSIKVPIIKMVDEGLTSGMVQWCLAHILRYHLDLDHFIQIQDGTWSINKNQLLPYERNVSILGLGNIGMQVARAIRDLGFNVSGWSTQNKRERNIKSACGEWGLKDILADADIVVCLLPETKDTINLFSASRFNYFKKGAKIINAGRGSLINEIDLLNSIKNGIISHATLDVFNTEPLPKEHPFWQNERITVTPHIAARSRPDTCVTSIIKNISRYYKGKDFKGMVNLKKGY